MIQQLAGRAVPDVLLVAAILGLLVVGIVMVRASTMEVAGELSPESWRHIVYGALGVGGLLVASRMHLGVLQRVAPVAYAGSIVLLLLVLALGTDQFGARRWIEVAPGVTIQPSEFAKIATVLAIAAYAAEREPGIRTMLTSLALAVLPMALVVVEPDLGTTLVLGIAWLVLIGVWGVPWRILGGLAALGVAVLPIAFALAVPDYQRERLAVFFDPGRDPLGSGFTMRQVELALGSGGWSGRGIDGAASALDGVATRASDFAFAQIGEQVGVLGALLVLALFGLVAWRGLEASVRAPDRFGRLLAAGLTATLVLQAAMHVAVNTRMFPTTGIPLPFISTGGSALVGACVAAGLIQAVAAYRAPGARYSSGDAWAGLRWR